MQISKNLRAGLCLALTLSALGASLVSCGDIGAPASTHDDEWADAVSVSMLVRTEGRAFSSDGAMTLAPTVNRQVLSVSRPKAMEQNNALLARGAGSIGIEHVRDSAGHVLSIATVEGESGQPPKRMYLFRDGRIQMVASAKYQRHGNSWIRKSLRLTVLDSSGRPLVQSDTKSAGDAALTGIGSAFRMAAFEGDALGEGGDGASGICEKERSAWLAKTAIAASISTPYIVAMYACIAGDPEACVRVYTLGPALIGASQAAFEAWEKWQSCKSSGGFPPTMASGPAENSVGGKKDGLSNLVDDFVTQAEAAGTYYCSSDGDSCTYFSGT